MEHHKIEMTHEELVAMTLAIASLLDKIFPSQQILEIIAQSAEVIYAESTKNTSEPDGTGENVEPFSDGTEAGESTTGENL